ncbi:molybdopterin biosynthesis enzyme [Micromonospora carbonacea subsp. aurantiaca]|nr:molybdopterin biosynthesis enzyme [Micromonospora carbonacea]
MSVVVGVRGVPGSPTRSGRSGLIPPRVGLPGTPFVVRVVVGVAVRGWFW